MATKRKSRGDSKHVNKRFGQRRRRLNARKKTKKYKDNKRRIKDAHRRRCDAIYISKGFVPWRVHFDKAMKHMNEQENARIAEIRERERLRHEEAMRELQAMNDDIQDLEMDVKINTDDLMFESSGPVDEQMTEPADEQMTEPAEEQMTEPADEQMTGPTEEQMTGPTDDQMTEPADEQVLELNIT
mgnify:CR=1 FL=1